MGRLICLMGPTGAGKSVQGDLLAETYGAVHLSSGKLLRKDPEVAAKMVDGQLVPAAEVERIIGDAMAGVPKGTLVVLDGFPRTDSNVQWLEQNLERIGRRLMSVVLIDLDIETSLKRLSLRGRADDAPDAIRAKYRLFDDVTRPVVEHYRKLGLLSTVDGRGTIEEVHDEIVAVLEKRNVIEA
jgi:adenylate kinase